MLRLQRTLTPPLIATLICVALIGFYILALSALYRTDAGWLVNAAGHPRTNEYVGVRAAGALALEGRAADAYDWALHRVAEAAITGAPVEHTFIWPYPPPYFFVAMALASMPFMVSALSWICVTLAFYAAAVARVARVRVAAVWAIASPAALINAFVAHTGFWTAGVLALGLDALPMRPLLAGGLFGLMIMKPQLGLLIPLALVAGGHWRTIGAAAATTTILIAASVVAFGVEPWLQFWPQLARVSANARDGHLTIELFATTYGFLRTLGVSHTPALYGQAIVGLPVAVAVFRLWRSQAPMALKAAGLVSGSLLASPYVFTYDLTHLTVVVAFLIRQNGLPGLSRTEITVIAAAMAMIFGLALFPVPLGFFANIHIGALVLARAWPYIRVSPFAWRFAPGPRTEAG